VEDPFIRGPDSNIGSGFDWLSEGVNFC
jgi:hypothetical protein